MINKASVNGARSLYYGLFSKLFVFTTNENRFEGVDDALAIMMTNPMDEHSMQGMKRLLAAIDERGVQTLVDEYDAIFHTPGRAPLRNTASYYAEGVESGKKRLEVKNFLAKTKIRRNESTFKENEDSVGFLMTFMHELVELIMSGESSYETLQHCVFTEIINPFIDEFVEALFEHGSSDLYKDIAIMLNAFMDFERLYFEAPKVPKKEKIEMPKAACEEISPEEAARRAANKAKKAAAQEAEEACPVFVAQDVETDI